MSTFKPISFIAETISVGGTPSRPERDHEAERKANRQTTQAIKKEHQLSDADFDYLASFADFPKIIGYDANHVPVRRRDMTEKWFANMRRILVVKVK